MIKVKESDVYIARLYSASYGTFYNKLSCMTAGLSLCKYIPQTKNKSLY